MNKKFIRFILCISLLVVVTTSSIFSVIALANTNHSDFEQLMGATSTAEMYTLILNLMQNDPDALLALSANEITSLRNRINELDPENDDVDTQDLLDTLAMLPNGGDNNIDVPVTLAAATIGSNQTWEGGTSIAENTTWTFHNGAVLSLKNAITVKAGKTLTLTGWGSVARYSSNTNALFIIEAGVTSL